MWPFMSGSIHVTTFSSFIYVVALLFKHHSFLWLNAFHFMAIPHCMAIPHLIYLIIS